MTGSVVSMGACSTSRRPRCGGGTVFYHVPSLESMLILCGAAPSSGDPARSLGRPTRLSRGSADRMRWRSPDPSLGFGQGRLFGRKLRHGGCESVDPAVRARSCSCPRAARFLVGQRSNTFFRHTGAHCDPAGPRPPGSSCPPAASATGDTKTSPARELRQPPASAGKVRTRVRHFPVACAVCAMLAAPSTLFTRAATIAPACSLWSIGRCGIPVRPARQRESCLPGPRGVSPDAVFRRRRPGLGAVSAEGRGPGGGGPPE